MSYNAIAGVSAPSKPNGSEFEVMSPTPAHLEVSTHWGL